LPAWLYHLSAFISLAASVPAKACSYLKERDWEPAPAVLFSAAITNPRISAEKKGSLLLISCK
jgi:hypothetical protein